MTVVDHFKFRVAIGLHRQPGGSDLLPTVIARACAEVLPVAGASLSLIAPDPAHPDLRVPLGFSDPVAARVERLQTTLGEGPCLTVAQTRVAMTVGNAAMAARWPTFHSELIRKTPIRSVVSLPLSPPPPATVEAALNLYFTTAWPDARETPPSSLTPIEHAQLSSHDALAVLRGYAYAEQTSLEWVAEQLITRQLDPGAVINTE